MGPVLGLGGWFPEDWPTARREWQSSLVVRNVHALKAWGCLES